jgi:hypothetical protein
MAPFVGRKLLLFHLTKRRTSIHWATGTRGD